MRKIGVVTTARSDYGSYLPLLKEIENDPVSQLNLFVTGMHLSTEFGLTVEKIENDGFEITDRVEMLLASDTPEGVAKSMGLGIIGFSQTYSRFHPDILVILGDRFEMYAAAVAALPFKIPIAHIHGGEVTQGAIDDALRHSITKLSHLHFASTQKYARRIHQMGEQEWRITVSGAPGLDNLNSVNLLTHLELEDRYGISMDQSPLLVTFHPVTLEYEQTVWQVTELLSALDEVAMPIIFTMPNADTNSRKIVRLIEAFVEARDSAWLVENFGMQGYFSIMALSSAMVGNSSSGIIEAASFKLPVVNIGSRQKGRVRPENVVDTEYDRCKIVEGIRRAVEPEFRRNLSTLVNPYSLGSASKIILKKLKEVNLDQTILDKCFCDV